VKPPPFQYYDPTTIAEALDILATEDNVKLLAGGQSLMPMLNMRYVQPDHIVDLNGIDELAYIREEGDLVRIGAMTRQRELEFSPVIRDKLPLMHDALMNVGHRQTRNRGTIGGSLCHLDPAAELVAVATAYDAIVTVRCKTGSRDVPIAEFPAAFMTPATAPDEIVTSISFAPWASGHAAFLEFSRRHGDFALASTAILLDLEGDHIRRVSVTIGGLSYAPKRVREAEAVLHEGPSTPDTFRAAADACGALEAGSDIHGSASYRQQLARVLTYRALVIVHERARPAPAER
jgi:aerobic carbon-monoxide dehydrogenase medium subunit